MKSKELIKQLQEIDPSGEIEVGVGRSDIYFVSKYPAYYDGPNFILTKDLSKTNYNIIGGTINFIE